MFYGWKIVAALFVILAFSSGLGFYSHSIIISALAQEAGFPLVSASGAVSVFFFVSGVSGLGVGALLEKYDVRAVVGAGACLAAMSLAALGSVSEIWELYVLYALFGIGFTSSGLLPATTLIARWFTVNRARALSLASTGLSVGGVLITPVCAALIASSGLAQASLWLGGMYLLGILPLCLLVLRSTPGDMSLSSDGEVTYNTSGIEGIHFSVAIRGRYFWTLSLSFLFVMLAQVGGIAHQFGLISEHLDAAQAAYAVAVLPLASIIGRLAGGLIIDRVSLVKFTVSMIFLEMTALAMMAIAPGPQTLIVGLALFGLSVGNLLMLQPLIIASVYGLVSYSRIYAWSNLVSMVGIAAGPVLMGYLAAGPEGYKPAFLVAAASAFLAGGIFVLGKPPLSARRRER